MVEYLFLVSELDTGRRSTVFHGEFQHTLGGRNQVSLNPLGL